MKNVFRTTVCVVAFCTGLPAFADDQSAGPGMKLVATTTTYVNQRGSELSFSLAPSNQPNTYTLTGTYINRATGTNCQNVPYPVSGLYYSQTGIASFSVVWSSYSENCQSATGWTGFFNTGFTVLQTNWNLVFGQLGSQSISTGSDTFTRKAMKTSSSLIAE